MSGEKLYAKIFTISPNGTRFEWNLTLNQYTGALLLNKDFQMSLKIEGEIQTVDCRTGPAIVYQGEWSYLQSTYYINGFARTKEEFERIIADEEAELKKKEDSESLGWGGAAAGLIVAAFLGAATTKNKKAKLDESVESPQEQNNLTIEEVSMKK